MAYKVVCGRCYGKGTDSGFGYLLCEACGGSGYIYPPSGDNSEEKILEQLSTISVTLSQIVQTLEHTQEGLRLVAQYLVERAHGGAGD